MIAKIDKIFNALVLKGNLDELQEAEMIEGKSLNQLYNYDFGMKIWDWPQWVGLYDLHKFNVDQNTNKFSEYLEKWFKSGYEKNSKNINTVCPMLTYIQ